MIRFFIIIYFLLCTSINAKDLVIVDIDFLIQNSKIGKNIINNLNKENKAIVEKFKTKEDEFINIEKNLISKKNILSENEFQKEIENFRKKISEYNLEKKKALEKFDIKKKEKYSNIVKKINDVLLKYSKENNITTILDKKYVLLSKSENDITKEILDNINKQ